MLIVQIMGNHGQYQEKSKDLWTQATKYLIQPPAEAFLFQLSTRLLFSSCVTTPTGLSCFLNFCFQPKIDVILSSLLISYRCPQRKSSLNQREQPPEPHQTYSLFSAELLQACFLSALLLRLAAQFVHQLISTVIFSYGKSQRIFFYVASYAVMLQVSQTDWFRNQRVSFMLRTQV